MTIINQKSISGITSITFASAGDDLLTFHSNNGTERFRIDNSGNTKITAGIVTTLTVTGDVDIADKIVHTGDTNTAIRFPAADTFTVETGGSERLRVHTDGNVLLGTTSNQGSSRKLQVAATDSSSGMEAIRFTTSAGSAPSLTLSKSNSDTLNANTLVDSGDSLGYVQFKAANGSGYNTAAQIVGEVDGTPGVNDMPGRLVLSTTADGASTPTERARIDSSGRFYVGGTANIAHPNMDDIIVGDASGNRGITVASATDGYGTLAFGDSTDGSGNDRYQGYVEYYHNDNSMRLGTVASERLRIDSSGRLLVGLTAAREHLNDGSDSAQIFLEGTTQNTSTLAVIRSSDNDGPAHLVLGKSRGGKGSTTVVQSGDTIGHINFEGADGDHLVRAAQISCLVDGTPGSNDMPGRLSFKTTPNGSNSLTERMRIRQNGEQQHFGTNATNINIANTASANNNNEFLYCQHSSTGLANGTNSFKVTTNGNVSNTNNSYGAISDQNLKENIVDATSQWNDIKGLQVRKYNFRENTGHETHTQLGLIAQEAESVSPGLVQTTPVKEGQTVLDADGNQLESIKSINYSVLYMKAVKALQEAQTRIETLETQNTAQQTQINDLITRVTALEG